MKAEKRKLAECARYAREEDERVMAAARTTADTTVRRARANDTAGEKKTTRRVKENGLLFNESALLLRESPLLFSTPLPLSHRRRVKGAR